MRILRSAALATCSIMLSPVHAADFTVPVGINEYVGELYDFEGVPVGTSSTIQIEFINIGDFGPIDTINIYHVVTDNISISNLSCMGTEAPIAANTPDYPVEPVVTIDSGESCTVQVTFLPGEAAMVDGEWIGNYSEQAYASGGFAFQYNHYGLSGQEYQQGSSWVNISGYGTSTGYQDTEKVLNLLGRIENLEAARERIIGRIAVLEDKLETGNLTPERTEAILATIENLMQRLSDIELKITFLTDQVEQLRSQY